jgi:hypothetical protein
MPSLLLRRYNIAMATPSKSLQEQKEKLAERALLGTALAALAGYLALAFAILRRERKNR